MCKYNYRVWIFNIHMNSFHMISIFSLSENILIICVVYAFYIVVLRSYFSNKPINTCCYISEYIIIWKDKVLFYILFQVLSCNLSLPFSLSQESLFNTLSSTPISSSFHSLTPCCSKNDQLYSQVCVLRGLKKKLYQV